MKSWLGLQVRLTGLIVTISQFPKAIWDDDASQGEQEELRSCKLLEIHRSLW